MISVEAKGAPEGKRMNQKLQSQALLGDAPTHLVWMPVTGKVMRLAWVSELTLRSTGEIQRVVVDAENSEPLSQACLTAYFMSKDKAATLAKANLSANTGLPFQNSTPAPAILGSAQVLSPLASSITLDIYTSDCPAPMTPGWPTSQTGQAPILPRSLVTLSSINPTASPNGWIDSNLDTRGNNVDAHSDTSGNNTPDLPRPAALGSNPAVYDFPLDSHAIAQHLSETRRSSSCFTANNFMHDKLYELGFTESAGNFQNDNFGRGGSGNDAVQADAQDGGGTR